MTRSKSRAVGDGCDQCLWNGNRRRFSGHRVFVTVVPPSSHLIDYQHANADPAPDRKTLCSSLEISSSYSKGNGRMERARGTTNVHINRKNKNSMFI